MLQYISFIRTPGPQVYEGINPRGCDKTESLLNNPSLAANSAQTPPTKGSSLCAPLHWNHSDAAPLAYVHIIQAEDSQCWAHLICTEGNTDWPLCPRPHGRGAQHPHTVWHNMWPSFPKMQNLGKIWSDTSITAQKRQRCLLLRRMLAPL